MPSCEAWYVARTMQTLELLAFRPLSAPQVAAALQVHPRTARRLLTRLKDEGYLTRTDDARRLYSPSMRVVALAGQIVAHAPLARRALPYVARLHEQTGADAHLAVPSYDSALCVVHHDADTTARPQPRELVPSHCTATGKALLGWRDPWRESVLSRPLERFTERTLVDRADLEREAELIRERGYATDDGEFREGVRAVAAPVFSSGEAVAALGASGPSVDIEAVAERVVVLAGELTRALQEDHG
ncbi:MAG: IclR family transcriptional regulator, acetate operon repressor [Solirubrobacteraceae bacterium]|nr:IclR family transcriptional regulator, acetate operon repressor [Solirubrobacteraceae bacterium]